MEFIFICSFIRSIAVLTNKRQVKLKLTIQDYLNDCITLKLNNLTTKNV